MLPYANDFAVAIQLFKKLRLPIFIQVVYNILCLAVIIGLDPVIIYCKFLARGGMSNKF